MGWEEVKDEKEGYVRVRKSNERSLIGRLKKANDDPEAKGYIELNKEDLGGMDGGGGPHSHSEYARKTHDHDDKADVNHTHDTTHTHNEFADKGHTHPPQDLTHDHFGQYAGKAEFDAHHHDGEYAEADALAQHLANHPEGGGDPYDDTQIRDDFAAADQNLQDQIDTINTSGYDDTELRGLIQGNTDALGDKSDTDHTHDPQDLTHDHDAEYAPVHEHPYASDTHDHDADYAPIHDHPYAPVHDHPYSADDHGHSEYFLSGQELDEHGTPIPLPFPDAKTLGEAVEGKADEHDHPYVKLNADTDIRPNPDNRFVSLKTRRFQEEDGTATNQEFGLQLDLAEGNTYKNQFQVTTGYGYALKVLGGSGKETWLGGPLTQKGNALENNDARDYIIRKNLTDATSTLATRTELEKIKSVVEGLQDAVAEIKEALKLPK